MKQKIKNAALAAIFLAATGIIHTMECEDEVLRERAKACEWVLVQGGALQECEE